MPAKIIKYSDSLFEKGKMDIIKLDKYRTLTSIEDLKGEYGMEKALEKITRNAAQKLSRNKLTRLDEALSENINPKIIKLEKYLRTSSNRYDEKAVVNYVTLEALPHGDWGEVWGMYELGRHTMYVAINLPRNKVDRTKRHEDVHSFGFRDEIMTERIASNPLSYIIVSAAA